MHDAKARMSAAETLDTINAITDAADKYAHAVNHEMRLEDERPGVKALAIERVMQGTNPLNGKPHSASSAEAVVETDQDYASYRKVQRFAVVEKIRAKAALDVAGLRARLALELLASGAEVEA